MINDTPSRPDAPLRILAITDPGCEHACAMEISGLLKKAKPVVRSNIVETAGSWRDAIELGYRSQTALRIIVAIAPTAKDLDELVAGAPDERLLADVLQKDGSFKAACELFDPALMAQEIVEGIGEWIHSTGARVDLTKPDVTIVGVATDAGIDAGIDVVGSVLSKREWRIMLSARSIKATIAASTAIYADVSAKDAILDPFGDDGTLAVETALLLTGMSPRRHARDLAFTRFPVVAALGWPKIKKGIDDHEPKPLSVTVFSDTMRDMKAVRMNAKLAGVDQWMRSTRVSLDWMDAKLEEGSIDRIITAPIASGKAMSPQRAAKLADQLFWQADFALGKKGTVTCLSEKPQELDAAALAHGFILASRHDVRMGHRPLTIVTYRKKGEQGSSVPKG